MRHNVSGRKLGRKSGHRLALFRNQIASLVASERIVTTLAKAKELRPIAERVVTQGKRGSVHARRLVGRWLPNRDLIKKLFDEIAPRFTERQGGYLRIVKLGSRQGDGAELAVLEFVDFAKKAKAAPAGAEKEKKGAESQAAEAEGKPKAEKAAKEKPAKEKATKAAAASTAPAKSTRKSAAPKSEGKAKPAKAPAGPKRGSAPRKSGSS
jgi:large subunit ribosomal protein L17